MTRRLLLLLASLFLAPRAVATPRFTVIRVDPQNERLELFLRDDSGTPFLRIARLDAWLRPRQRELRFAMNAGMFEVNYAPVGLFVAQGKEQAPLNLASGAGNFFLKPNGVFLVTANGPKIVESTLYPSQAGAQLATQSGPLLLANGVIHPAFNPASKSRLIRNAVGVAGREALFVISEEPVTFHELAVYFRDQLQCSDALYLDGVVSSLYCRELGRDDARADLGPIIGVVRPV